MRDEARGIEELAAGVALALVMREEDTGALVHLADDDPLGAVDDERAGWGHQGDFPKVDVLFLDFLDVLLSGAVFLFPHDQAQRDPDGAGKGDATNPAFLNIVLGITQAVVDVLEGRQATEVGDGEHRAEHGLEPFFSALIGRHIALEKPLIGVELNAQHVRHVDRRVDLSEGATDAVTVPK